MQNELISFTKSFVGALYRPPWPFLNITNLKKREKKIVSREERLSFYEIELKNTAFFVNLYQGFERLLCTLQGVYDIGLQLGKHSNNNQPHLKL